MKQIKTILNPLQCDPNHYILKHIFNSSHSNHIIDLNMIIKRKHILFLITKLTTNEDGIRWKHLNIKFLFPLFHIVINDIRKLLK